MSRTTVVWIAIGLSAAAGCRMCASPYDYCSPTFTGGCGEDCDPFVRAGSILSGPVDRPMLAPDDYGDPGVPDTEEIGRIQVDQEDASPLVVSETDGEGDEPAEQGPALGVEEGPALPVEAARTPAVELTPAPSDGWRAVKRRSDTVVQ